MILKVITLKVFYYILNCENSAAKWYENSLTQMSRMESMTN